MPRGRNTTGHRHQITYRHVPRLGMTLIQAMCICDGLKSPPRFARLAAEEDGQEHMKTYAKQSMGRQRGKKLS